MRDAFTTSAAVRCLSMLLALALVAPSVALASPTNAKIDAARQKATDARDRLDELSADLEERTEEYLEAEDALERTKTEIRMNEVDLRLAEEDLARETAQLNDRVASIYRNGDVDWISVILGVSSFQDFVTRLDLMQRIGDSDALVVARVKDARARLASIRASLENRKTEQSTLKRDAEEKFKRLESAVTAQEQYIASLDATLKKLVAEERARQERVARERAAEQAARAAAAGKSGRGGRQFDPAALGKPHSEVVSIARRYVGTTPYVWGGTTPSGFDCSGLVLYCYREIGIALPRTSRQQYKVGAFIPPDRLDLLAPGDLVFFGRNGDPGRIHHVGIYIGGGDMIHAPQTGEMVSVASLTGRIASRGDYVGAVRP